MMNSTFQFTEWLLFSLSFPSTLILFLLRLFTHTPNRIWHKAVFKVGVSNLHWTGDKLLAFLYWDISSILALQLLIKYEMCCQTLQLFLCVPSKTWLGFSLRMHFECGTIFLFFPSISEESISASAHFSLMFELVSAKLQ